MRFVRATMLLPVFVIGFAAVAAPVLGTDGDGEQAEVTTTTAEEVSSEAPPRSDAAAYTQYFVQQAIDLYDAEGREATLAYYNDPASVDGQWYVFIVDADGTLVGHATRPDLLGTSTAARRDVYGKAYGREIVAATAEGHWVDYFFTYPETGRPEQKHSWIVRHDGLFFGSGWYVPGDPEAPPKMNRRAYTKHLVQQAIDRYTTEGADYAIDYHNSPESTDGEWYVFVFGEADGIFVAHPTRPDLVGTDINDLVAEDGFGYGSALAAADESGVWVDYEFDNPRTGRPAPKHSWAVEHDGLVFGAGWYESDEVPLRSDVATYTQYLVQQAIDRYEAEGRDATIAYYNDPATADGQWYVYILDEMGRTTAHPTVPSLLGDYAGDNVDINGKAYGEELVAATEVGRWVDYYFHNPESGEPEAKYSWVVRHDGLIFGSGWYRVPEEQAAETEPAPAPEATPTDIGPGPDAATG